MGKRTYFWAIILFIHLVTLGCTPDTCFKSYQSVAERGELQTFPEDSTAIIEIDGMENVNVGRIEYSEGLDADIYYPPDRTAPADGELLPYVVLVTSFNATNLMDYYGTTYLNMKFLRQ